MVGEAGPEDRGTCTWKNLYESICSRCIWQVTLYLHAQPPSIERSAWGPAIHQIALPQLQKTVQMFICAGG